MNTRLQESLEDLTACIGDLQPESYESFDNAKNEMIRACKNMINVLESGRSEHEALDAIENCIDLNLGTEADRTVCEKIQEIIRSVTH